MSVLPFFRGIAIGLGVGFSWIAGVEVQSGEVSRFLIAAVVGVVCLAAAAAMWHHERSSRIS